MKNIYIYVSSSSTFMKSRAAPSKDLEIQGSSSIQNPPPPNKNSTSSFPLSLPSTDLSRPFFSNLWNFTEISTFSVAEKAQS